MESAADRPVLRTARLTLRPCRPDDRSDFIGLERDAEVMRYLNGGHPVDRAKAGPDATFLMPSGTEPYVWTARRTDAGAFVGWFCLWPEGATLAELGYRLRREEWGQGLATEGASAIVAWGLGSGRYGAIVACTMAAHRASRRVLEKIGLHHMRTVQVDWADAIPGGEQGEVWYEARRSDWTGSAPQGLDRS